MKHDLKLGHIITDHQERDAAHIAVAPIIAAASMSPGEHVGLSDEGSAVPNHPRPIGVIDPFLRDRVRKGEKCWLFMYPNTITSLCHEWEHPAFAKQEAKKQSRSESEIWMRHWAVCHMGEDYYGMRSEDEAFARAINAGHTLSVGPHEDARDHIDDEWWSHWEKITGQAGKRDESFSCGC